MKRIVKLILAGSLCGSLFLFGACGAGGAENSDGSDNSSGFVNEGDKLGGGGIAETPPSVASSDNGKDASAAAGEIEKDSALPQNAVPVTSAGKLTESGNYVVRGALEGKIGVKAENVHLYLDGASLTCADDKVITSDFDLTITLLGENSAETTALSTNAISCDGALTVNGSGSLHVVSTKNAVKANSIAVAGATLTVEAEGDGLHAEIDAYDTLTEAPAFSYEDGGWIVLDGAHVTVNSKDDGLQADTFVLIKGESEFHVTTNGGAPQKITELSSDSGDGKGIKAGAIDWGENGEEIVSDGYFIGIESGTVDINANDDAIHSDGEIAISGGTLTIAAGDDALHAEELLNITNGSVTVFRCYEGLEAAKVEISGGNIFVSSADDGVNASDGSANKETNNPNCHIIVSGGEIEVSAEGDGIDSNGSMLFSGGTVFVSGPTNGGNAALDSNGGILINGGYVFAVGPIGMVETPASNSAQNVVSFARSTSIAAGTNISLTDENGEALFSYTARKACQSVILSCPELQTGKSYAIYGGDASLCTFTVSSRITTVGSSGGIGNPGGMPPGGFGGGMGRPGGRK